MKPDILWTHPYLWEFVQLLPNEAHSLLDLGCGRGLVGALAGIYREYDRIAGVDAFEPYLNFARSHGFYTELRKVDLNDLLPYADKEFDVVTCLEVIEHLDKEVGSRLIEEMQRIGRRVIIGTPDRFHEQPEFDGNRLQRHQSLWSPKEMKHLGYKVLKARGRLNIAIGPLHLTTKHEYLAWKDLSNT